MDRGWGGGGRELSRTKSRGFREIGKPPQARKALHAATFLGVSAKVTAQHPAASANFPAATFTAANLTSESPPRFPSQMGLDTGPPPLGTASPQGECYLDAAALPLPDQVQGIGVPSHRLQESLASEHRDGGHIRVLLGVPLSTSGQEPGVSASPGATLYVWDVPSGLSMVLTVTSGLVDLRFNPHGCPESPEAHGCTLEENVASGSPSQVSPPRG